MTHPAYDVTDGQYQIVYDFLSFTFACMAASTIFFWLRLPSIAEKYKSALVITGLVTFIAAYHYLRIFNSWTEAYQYPSYQPPVENPKENPKAYVRGDHEIGDPILTG